MLFQSLFLFGAKGRNRTADTAIFSRMLYRLSYLGVWPPNFGGQIDFRPKKAKTF